MWLFALCLIAAAEPSFDEIKLQQTIDAHVTFLEDILIDTPPRRRQEGVEKRKDLSFPDFFHKFAMRGRPVVVPGGAFRVAQGWSFEHVRNVCADRMADARFQTNAKAWGGLKGSTHISIRNFVDAYIHRNLTWRAPEGFEGLIPYVHDWPLPIHCPDLLEGVSIPSYFTNNLYRRVRNDSEAFTNITADPFPSLFIGPQGTYSRLHVDFGNTHFWMALFEGKKHWRFFNSTQRPLLYEDRISQSFGVDAFAEDFERFPLSQHADVFDIVLEPGDLLFVPGGSPHQVLNLENTLAISGNYVDESNFDMAMAEISLSSGAEPDLFVKEARLPSFPVAANMHSKDLPYEEYRQQVLPGFEAYYEDRSFAKCSAVPELDVLFIAVFCSTSSAGLLEFFSFLGRQDYPEECIHIHVRANDGFSPGGRLSYDWIATSGRRYLSSSYNDMPIGRSERDHAGVRDEALRNCHGSASRYCVMLNDNCMLSNPRALRLLVERRVRGVLAPVLQGYSPRGPTSGVTFQLVPEEEHLVPGILNGSRTCDVCRVPLARDVFVIDRTHPFADELSFSPQQFKEHTEEELTVEQAFSLSALHHGVPIFVSNRDRYGFLVHLEGGTPEDIRQAEVGMLKSTVPGLWFASAHDPCNDDGTCHWEDTSV